MLRRRLATILLAAASLVLGMVPAVSAGPSEFPPGYEGYHTYAEIKAELDAAVAAYGAGKNPILKRYVIGESHEGRKIWAIKISDNVATDEDEPEVLLESGMHAREHLSVEMSLYAISLLTENYGKSTPLGERVTGIVNSREIWIIPIVNPDGAEYDISGGKFRNWRKNRQPIPGTSEIGIDLNRNFGFQWGCCKGGSNNPSSILYRGAYPFEATEAAVLRDFVLSRRVGGRQQISAAINWHTYGEYVLFPYGYTKKKYPETITKPDRKAMVALAKKMASLNGYRARQGSQWYIYDGDFPAWAYGDQRIFTFTLEMYPRGSAKGGFYPPDSIIEEQTTRNTEALLYLLEQADCTYRAVGKAAANCGPLYDDFEVDRGWKVNPNGKDTASQGAWERAAPAKTTDAAGIRQRKKVTSGQTALVTGATAGKDAAANDVDGGTTSVLSPKVKLGSGTHRLVFRYTFAYSSASGPDDFLRVSVISGGTTTPVWTLKGKAKNRLAKWKKAKVSLAAWQGSEIRLLFEARDGGVDNVLEAVVDDVRIRKI